jgi:3-oxoacyl-[acyl-carrier protein] reductase
MNPAFEGRTAVVTGGASGIGAATARMLDAEGASVWIADRNLDGARRVAAGLEGGHAIRIDVRDRKSVKTAIAGILRVARRIDVLVNCAGIMTTGEFTRRPVGDWDAVCATNLSGTVYCCHAVAPAMIRNGFGRIVNMASVAAVKGGGLFGNVAYGATKAGVVALTKGLARELGPHGITVHAIGPAVTETPMVAHMITPALRKSVLPRFPAGRFATPEEIAGLIRFLVGGTADYMTGQTVFIDGGFLTR